MTDDKLDEALQDSEQYYSVHEFVFSCNRFQLLLKKDMISIKHDLTSAFDFELGICDECQRTRSGCCCVNRYNEDYDDDIYDRYHDR